MVNLISFCRSSAPPKDYATLNFFGKLEKFGHFLGIFCKNSHLLLKFGICKTNKIWHTIVKKISFQIAFYEE